MYRTQIIQARIIAVLALALTGMFTLLYGAALSAGALPLAGAALLSALIAGLYSMGMAVYLHGLEQRAGRYTRISRSTLRRA